MAESDRVEAGGVSASAEGLISALRTAGERITRQAVAHDLWYTALFLYGVLILSFAFIVAHDGWPMNHDLLFWKNRLLIYAEHVRRLDILPIWSESAALGLGAPVPVLYHKLFYLPATALYLLSGSVKASILGALAAFSVVGVLGLRALFIFVGIERRAALVAGAVLLFCNYTYTDWLVRGAFAEHSAMMLIPWLFRWLFGVLQGEAPRRLLRAGAVTFPALYLAHTSLFFFSAGPVLAASIWRLTRRPDRAPFLRALLGIAGAFALVAVPIIVCQLALVPELNFREGISVFAPKDYFAPLDRYLTGGDYAWGREWGGYSVKLDTPLVVTAALALVWTLHTQIRQHVRQWRNGSALPPSEFDPSAWLRGYFACWLCVVYFGLLQSPASRAAYEKIPGFWALQFPWRLLSFGSALSVILAALPLLRVVRFGSASGSTAFAWLLLGLTYASSPWPHEIEYDWIPRTQLEEPLAPTARLHLGGSEYHPKVPGKSGAALMDYLGALQPTPDAPQWRAARFSVERLDVPAFEKGSRHYRVRATEPSVIVLPIAYSPFIRVEQLVNGERVRLPIRKEPADPRIHIDVPTGTREVLVRFPTLPSVYVDLISRAFTG